MKFVNYNANEFENVTSQFEAKFVLLDVLTQDDTGQYAAYRAIVDSDFPREEWFFDRIMERGTKLTCREAITSFPKLPISKYRD